MSSFTDHEITGFAEHTAEGVPSTLNMGRLESGA
jgi:hypothetical protein